MDLLEEVIRLACEMSVPLSYVETNAGWCTDRETAEDGMRRMRAAGLPAILISVSVFHNEFIPFRCTRTAVEAAREIFGRHNVFVYLPQMYELLSRMPDEECHSLREFCEWAGIELDSPMIPQM